MIPVTNKRNIDIGLYTIYAISPANQEQNVLAMLIIELNWKIFKSIMLLTQIGSFNYPTNYFLTICVYHYRLSPIINTDELVEV